jgi:hypothetical protein
MKLKKESQLSELIHEEPSVFYMSKAICSDNVYHIYRDNGVEVQITLMKEGRIKTTPQLYINEINFLREYYPEFFNPLRDE